MTAAAKVGRPPGAKGGGNGNKRLRVYLTPAFTANRSDAGIARVVAGTFATGGRHE